MDSNRSLLEARRRLAAAANDLAAAIDADLRMQATVGSSASQACSGGDPDPQPVAEVAISGQLRVDPDLARTRDQATKLVVEAVELIRSQLEPQTPSRRCGCCQTRTASTRLNGDGEGLCGKCDRQRNRTGECGREAHRRWDELGESTTVTESDMCQCNGPPCTRPHARSPVGGCNAGQQHGRLCKACSMSRYRSN